MQELWISAGLCLLFFVLCCWNFIESEYYKEYSDEDYRQDRIVESINLAIDSDVCKLKGWIQLFLFIFALIYTTSVFFSFIPK